MSEARSQPEGNPTKWRSIAAIVGGALLVLLTTQFPRLREILGRIIEPLVKSAQG
jgi:hypothetical protein